MTDKPDIRNGILQSIPSMTLRDWFAGQVLGHVNGLQTVAYDIADGMLAVRDSSEKECARQASLALIGELAVRDWTGATDPDKAALREAIEAYAEQYMTTAPDDGRDTPGILTPGPHPAGRMVGAERAGEGEK